MNGDHLPADLTPDDDDYWAAVLEAITRFTVSVIERRKEPICLKWALEISAFRAEHSPHQRAPILKAFEPAVLLVALTEGTTAEQQAARDAINRYTVAKRKLPDWFLEEIGETNAFSDSRQAKRGRKRTEHVIRNASIAAEIFKRRKADGCFPFPDDPGAFLYADPVETVETIERADESGLKLWLEDRVHDGAFPLHDPESLVGFGLGYAQLARIYREDRQRLIVRELLVRLLLPDEAGADEAGEPARLPLD